MRKAGTEGAVRPRAGDGADHRDRHHGNAASDEGKVWTGARSGQGPAESEDDPSDPVAMYLVHRFGRNLYLVAAYGLDVERLDQRDSHR